MEQQAWYDNKENLMWFGGMMMIAGGALFIVCQLYAKYLDDYQKGKINGDAGPNAGKMSKMTGSLRLSLIIVFMVILPAFIFWLVGDGPVPIIQFVKRFLN